MKILHVLDHSIPLHSGYTFRTRSLLREQHKLGWKTSHITSSKHNQAINEEFVPWEEVDGLGFYRTPDYLPQLNSLPVLNQALVIKGLEKRLYQVVLKENPDIIHAHSPALNGLAAINVGKKVGIPVVYEIRAFWEDAAVDHGTTKEGDWRYNLTRALETKVIKKADAVTTICEGLRRDIIDRGVPENKVTVIPNAVDIEKFSIIEEKNKKIVKKYDLENAFVVGFIGSFYGYEGLHLIIQAADRLRECMSDLRILMVGGGPEENNLKEMVRSKGLSDMVIFTGRVPHAEVNEYYSVIDVLAYPRLGMRLTELVTPLKPLEAMAQKSLFVASNVGGHLELVKDNETGVLFEKDDPEDLAAKIMMLKNDQSLRHKLRENGRLFVENERNWTNSVANYKSIYHRLSGFKAFKNK